MLGCSRHHIYRLIKKKNYPEPVKLGTRCPRWWRHEIVAWAKQLERGLNPELTQAATEARHGKT
ncbi:MAG: AlpA family phage regulatory protein [Proteobacteria bacterium]|nr:AlpA family phage regulatory protein [Pseudomonadota bacterium]